VEGDPQPRSGGQTVETLPDAVGMRWSPVLECEAGVVVGAEEVALAVLQVCALRLDVHAAPPLHVLQQLPRELLLAEEPRGLEC
jgi:hypothetical protein